VKLTIFSGTGKNGPFLDSFIDGEGFTDEEYADCSRFDFEISEDEIEKRVRDKSADFETFSYCLKEISRNDINRYIYQTYRNELESELIPDAINSQLRTIVIDEWVCDCLQEIKQLVEENGKDTL
jgi:hypothetical protein